MSFHEIQHTPKSKNPVNMYEVLKLKNIISYGEKNILSIKNHAGNTKKGRLYKTVLKFRR